jgi:outer membrane protein
VKKTVVSILALFVFFAGNILHAQTQKIGYVNSSTIFQQLPAAKEAQKRIEALSKPLQDSLEAMQRDLQGRYEDYQKKEALMNEASKKAKQQELVDLERRMNEFRTEKFGAEGELAKQTEKIINPIRDRIKTAISNVAKEEKYSFVFDKTDQIQILLYGEQSADITYKVIDKLTRGK